VAERFDFEKTSIGLKADLPQPGQVPQPLAGVKITGVVHRGSGAGPDLGYSGNLLIVLLDTRAFVIDLQRWDPPSVSRRVRKRGRRSLADPPLEDQLHLVGTARIEVFAK
jgi:hypothetical protein